MNKLKTIIGMLAVAGAMTGFAATDAELKAMLEAKDYKGFAFQANSIQLTNLLTEATALQVVTEYAKTNVITRTKYIIAAKLVDPIDAINIYVENKNAIAMYFAVDTKNEDIFVDTWSKLIDIPEANIIYIAHNTALYKYTAIKNQHLELTKKTAERILKESPNRYITFVFNTQYGLLNEDYIKWMKSCFKNVNANTITTVDDWKRAIAFDNKILQAGIIRSSMYYFEDIWKINKITDKSLIYDLWSTEYKDKAIDTLAKSLTDPESTYKYFSLEVDKFAKNKEMTKRMFPVIVKDIHYGLKAALYLNDADKFIDILLAAKEELTAEELNIVIPMINSLEIDYRKDDIVKALRNINGRYTLKLYDDRETWEPILSKIRALIDVRQM